MGKDKGRLLNLFNDAVLHILDFFNFDSSLRPVLVLVCMDVDPVKAASRSSSGLADSIIKLSSKFFKILDLGSVVVSQV